jgi:hypothetical protein
LKFIVDQIATPRLTGTGSRRLPDSPIRGVGDSPTHHYGESATPRLPDTESRRLPDSTMQGVYKRKNNSLISLCVPVVAGISGSLESIPGLLKHFQIRAQATLASGIGSLESIPGLLKRLKIRAQATLASGTGSLESIPGLLKCLQTRAQATLASGIGSLESIPWLHNMKIEDEDDFFGLKRIYSSLNYQRDEE